MEFTRNNFYIFTGGPGTGKTTLMETLRARGYSCVEEAARKILQQQMKFDGDAVNWKDRIKYRELMLSWSVDAFESVEERIRPVFFDRGIPELIGYSAMIKADVPAYLQRAVDLFRYNPMAFIAPPWKKIYCNDTERKQTFEEAIDAYQATIACYEKCGYSLVEIPRASPAERADFVLRRIASC
ncbi:MAG: AAA family ATPase [Candidatus Binataceae bacterium]